MVKTARILAIWFLNCFDFHLIASEVVYLVSILTSDCGLFNDIKTVAIGSGTLTDLV
jgi:hypothetical protein